MSHIAEALAKAKQRADASAPLARPATDIAQQLARARRAQRIWITLLSVAALGAALLIWQRLPSDPTPPPDGVANTPATDPAPTDPALSATIDATTAAPSSATQPVAGAALNAPAPNTATAQAVHALVITAVLPGDRPRLMYQGRIVAMGEPVAPGLIFAGARDQRLFFTDARGATYERKY